MVRARGAADPETGGVARLGDGLGRLAPDGAGGGAPDRRGHAGPLPPKPVDIRPYVDPADMGPSVGPERGDRVVVCMDAWKRAGRAYAELAERVPRADGSPGHVSKSMLTKIRKNPGKMAPSQAKAIADAAAEVSGLDWRYVVSGVVRDAGMRFPENIVRIARYRKSLSAAMSAAQAVISRTAVSHTVANITLAQAFATLAMLAQMAAMPSEEKALRAFVDIATEDARATLRWEEVNGSIDSEQFAMRTFEKAANMHVS